MNTLFIALRTTLFTLVVTGLVYPLVTTAAAQVLFPARANGSLVTDDKGQVIGSELIGQGFGQAGYFQPRPSAAGDKGWDATASGGSNYSATSRKLRDRMEADAARLKKENPGATGAVPVELVSASASGLDPEISPEAAAWQVQRVATARGVDAARLVPLVEQHTEGRDLGVLGERRVNVLMLNLALDQQFGRMAAPAPTVPTVPTAPTAPTPPPEPTRP
jgi:K+-transporting ATPase ATPase C chain